MINFRFSILVLINTFQQLMRHPTLAKIVCTIGPSSWDEKSIKAMAVEGMNVARINASFADFAELDRVASLIRRVAPKTTIMLDSMGHKIRVTGFEEDRKVNDGDKVILMPAGDGKLLKGYIATTYSNLYKFVKPGNDILIDDGNISLEVVEVKGKEVICKVKAGGVIKRRKTVNVPNVHLEFPGLNDKDRGDIKFAVDNHFDLVSASFIRNREDVMLVKEVVGDSGLKIFSKVEDWEGVKNFDEILEVSDGIMVARGDMGVELPIEKIPMLQKQFIKKCREAGKPVIVATQMLESMKDNIRPTRAEVTDVANAVLDGADMLMLSAETSTGKHPIESVRTMCTVIKESQKMHEVDILHTRTGASEEGDALCRTVAEITEDIDIKTVIVLSRSGRTLASLARHRLKVPIWGATNNPLLARQFNLYFGTHGLLIPTFASEKSEVTKQVVGGVYSKGHLDLDDKIAIISGNPVYDKSSNSILEIVTAKEALG